MENIKAKRTNKETKKHKVSNSWLNYNINNWKMPRRESEPREERTQIKMLLVIVSLMSVMILVMAISLLVYTLQKSPGELSGLGGQPSPAPRVNPGSETGPRVRSKRELSGKKDECLSTYGGLELDYVNGSTTSFTFDLCDVLKCGGADSSWRGYNVWICWDYAVDTHCGRGSKGVNKSQFP